MKLEITSGTDRWLRQVVIKDSQKNDGLAYYQNCLTHCCGLSGLGDLFQYNGNLSKEDVDLFVKQFQDAIDTSRVFGYGVGEHPLFQSPCILFTTSEETDGNNSITLLTQHPQVSKKFEFTNMNQHVVSVWAIELKIPPH